MQGKRFVTILVAITMSDATHAQMAYCCENAGRVSLQTHRCEGNARQTIKGIEPICDDPNARQRRARIEAEMDHCNAAAKVHAGMATVRHRTYYDGVLVSTSSEQTEARCAVAKAERDDTSRRAGRRRNFDLLRRLDEAVRVACGGR